MRTQRYSDLSLGLNRKGEAQRIPLHGTIEATRRCPLNCVHCYNNLPLNDPEARPKELSYEEHCRILDEIAEAGCFWLLYTGGEIFARRDFLDLYAYAREKGLLITLFTNATLITREVADHLSARRPFLIEVTLYGRTKETYERITRIPGSFDRCLRGIHLLRERGLPLHLKTMAITLNRHEIWEMKRFAEEELGLPFRFDPAVNPRMDSSKGPLRARLTPQEVVDLDLRDPQRLADWKRLAALADGRSPSSGQGEELYDCMGGLSSFSIDPYGKMNICMLSGSDPYDLRQGSFREGWEGFLWRKRRRKATRHTKCRTCAMKVMCGMCPPSGELENRDPEAPVDFLCRVAHLRAKAVGIDVKPHGDCEYCGTGQSAATSRAGAGEANRSPATDPVESMPVS